MNGDVAPLILSLALYGCEWSAGRIGPWTSQERTRERIEWETRFVAEPVMTLRRRTHSFAMLEIERRVPGFPIRSIAIVSFNNELDVM
jgi:hypothetical protein